MNWLMFAIRNVLRNRRRSLVTLAISALGAAAILLSGGFALFTYERLEEASARDTGHFTVARAEYFEREEDVPLELGIDDYAELGRQLRTDSDVTAVLPRVQFTGLLSNGEKSAIMIGVGIDLRAELDVKGPFLTMQQGSALEDEGSEAPRVLIGAGLARSLSASPGDGLTLLASTTEGALNALDVEVQGVFSTGIPELDKRQIYTDIATAQQLIASERVSDLRVYLRSLDRAPLAMQRWAQRLGDAYGFKGWREQAVFYRSVRDLYNRIFGALGAVIVLIVMFVIANAMAMAIIERTRESGALRALGALPEQLTRMFALEGATLGAAGALLGACIALGVSFALRILELEMPPPPGRSSGYPLQVAVWPPIYAYVVCAIAILSMACSWIIARRGARKSIVAALAHV